MASVSIDSTNAKLWDMGKRMSLGENVSLPHPLPTCDAAYSSDGTSLHPLHCCNHSFCCRHVVGLTNATESFCCRHVSGLANSTELSVCLNMLLSATCMHAAVTCVLPGLVIATACGSSLLLWENADVDR